MDYVIIVFRSRTHTVGFSNALTKTGISNQIISTPKELGVGCGLSVKIRKEHTVRVKRLLRGIVPNTFVGIFSVKHVAGSKYIRSI